MKVQPSEKLTESQTEAFGKTWFYLFFGFIVIFLNVSVICLFPNVVFIPHVVFILCLGFHVFPFCFSFGVRFLSCVFSFALVDLLFMLHSMDETNKN